MAISYNKLEMWPTKRGTKYRHYIFTGMCDLDIGNSIADVIFRTPEFHSNIFSRKGFLTFLIKCFSDLVLLF
jgi:hypothetical protein